VPDGVERPAGPVIVLKLLVEALDGVGVGQEVDEPVDEYPNPDEPQGNALT
jgi:hypothetical protein